MLCYIKFFFVIARAVHLERDVSYTETANDGIISHWFVHNWTDPAYNFENVLLEGSNSSLVIQNTGLYLIYAQVSTSLNSCSLHT